MSFLISKSVPHEPEGSKVFFSLILLLCVSQLIFSSPFLCPERCNCNPLSILSSELDKCNALHLKFSFQSSVVFFPRFLQCFFKSLLVTFLWSTCWVAEADCCYHN